MKKWKCEVCDSIFKTKKALIEDLAGHFDDATTEADIAQNYLEELGVENPYDI